MRYRHLRKSLKSLKDRRMMNRLQKTIAVSLFALAPVTLTACSFDFRIPENEQQYIDKMTDSLKDTFNTFNILNDFAEEIDGKDVSDDEIENILTDLFETGNGLEASVKEEMGINAEFVSARVVRVVDGDTIVVEINNEEKKVRLIGIDTPESVASQEYLDRTGKENTEAGRTASDYTKSLLTAGQTVYLQKDTSDTDRYGRLLRYVWLEVPDDKDSVTEIATKMLNGILVKDGYAEVATYPPDSRYCSDFGYIYAMSHDDGYCDEDYSEMER